MEKILFTQDLVETLKEVLAEMDADMVLLVSDDNVKRYIGADLLRKLSGIITDCMTIVPGENSKSISMASALWQWLMEHGATRNTVIVNLGGGVVTDLGGFVAATYMRGIRFINIPTTLLGGADAAVGGKTGVDFHYYKNLIGVFAEPQRVIISPEVLKTLPYEQILGGMGEVVKMAMLTDSGWYEEILKCKRFDDLNQIAEWMYRAACEKEKIVAQDFRDMGIRRLLNFGHTVGHAIESFEVQTGIKMSHGAAVAYGIDSALKMSEIFAGLNTDVRKNYEERFLLPHFGPSPVCEDNKEEIVRYMTLDKKGIGGEKVAFVMLKSIGEPVIKEIFIDEIEL